MEPSHDLKRKANDNESDRSDKRQKKQWRVPRLGESNQPSAKTMIQPGDSGIWATCDKGREGKCIGELRDLFAEYAETLYGTSTTESKPDSNSPGNGIENDIEAEISDLQRSKRKQLFMPIRIDVQCVVFFKTEPPVDPVALVKRICSDAIQQQARKRTRFVKRLSPMTLMGRASEEGLDAVARTVLAPYFHSEPVVPHKFAIRPTLRNHNTLSRDKIIQQVARIVGPDHAVDLKNYDLLIIVEAYKNICGVSVLDQDFEALKRYNLAEIYDPTPREDDSRDFASSDRTKQKLEPTQMQLETAPPAI